MAIHIDLNCVARTQTKLKHAAVNEWRKLTEPITWSKMVSKCDVAMELAHAKKSPGWLRILKIMLVFPVIMSSIVVWVISLVVGTRIWFALRFHEFRRRT